MIAVDWGTTNLRLYRIADDGAVLETRRSADGTLASRGRYGEVLATQVAGWDDAEILLCGMVGARGGWHELPYLDCPAGLDQLAAQLQPLPVQGLESFEGRRLWGVPGLRDQRAGAVPDVMRGEESQLAGLLEALARGTHQVCLPGTHSKWVTIDAGRIVRIRTAMTGELYAVLRRHSVLGALMPAEDGPADADAFAAGLRRSMDAGGLLHHLFGVRTTGLFGSIASEALPSYLSGLLVGHELRDGALFEDGAPPPRVHLVGSERLLEAYARALAAFGVGAERHGEHLAAHGLHALWARRRVPDPDCGT